MTSKLVWEDLRIEFEKIGGPGQLWRAEIKRICQYRIQQKKNLGLPAELFGFVDWDVDDLAQTVITERLLARGQARFIFDTVESIDHARKLLSNEVSFTLEDRRVPNQVDNVWANLEPRLREAGWSPEGKGPGNNSEDDAKKIKEIARQILNLKRLRNRGQQRLSPLFAGETLAGLAEQIVSEHPQVSAYVIQMALRTALAKISPRLSMEAVGSTEKEFDEVAGRGTLGWVDSLDSSEGLFAHAQKVLEILGQEGSEIVFQIASGATQSEISAVLGVSRTTAVKRIEQAQELLVKTLKSLELGEEDNLKIIQEVFVILGAGITDGVMVK
jgi:hypothetical protein